MPITAKLSRQFYEKLGDEVTNELVTWLNAVDDSYRQEFRELFAANFGQIRSEMALLRAEVETSMGRLRAEMDGLRGDVDVRLAQLRVEAAEAKASLIRWMFVFWIGQVAVTIGAIVAARQLLR